MTKPYAIDRALNDSRDTEIIDPVPCVDGALALTVSSVSLTGSRGRFIGHRGTDS